MKKVISIILSVIMVLSIVPITASAEKHIQALVGIILLGIMTHQPIP